MCAVGNLLHVADVFHLDLGFRIHLLQIVRNQRVRIGKDLLEVALVALIGDDGRALGHKVPQSLGVIEVRVGVDDVLDRLAREPASWLRG